MSQDILFLAHRLPFPPDRGDKIRSHHILQRLARIAPVHVATFADDPGDLAHEGMLAGLARSYCLRVRSKPLWRAGLLGAFLDAALGDDLAPAARAQRMADILARLVPETA